MEVQLRASQEDGDRLRKEREQLRDRLSELQSSLREKEAEVSVAQVDRAQRGRSGACVSPLLLWPCAFHRQMEQEQGLVFELQSMNRSLQQKALGEDGILDGLRAQPLSLLSEIQQSQVSHIFTHTHTCTH